MAEPTCTGDELRCIAAQVFAAGMIPRPAKPGHLWVILVPFDEARVLVQGRRGDLAAVQIVVACPPLADAPFSEAYKAELRAQIEAAKGYPILVLAKDEHHEAKGLIDLTLQPAAGATGAKA